MADKIGRANLETAMANHPASPHQEYARWLIGVRLLNLNVRRAMIKTEKLRWKIRAQLGNPESFIGGREGDQTRSPCLKLIAGN